MSNSDWNLDDFDPLQKDPNVRGNVLAGFYHAQIVDCRSQTKPNKGETFVFSWEIIGTENDPKKLPMLGRTLYDFLNDYSTCKERFRHQIFALALAIGYWSHETLANAKEQGRSIPAPDFSQFVGLTCIIKVEEEEYAGKMYSRIRGFYSVESKEALEHGVMIADTPPNVIDDVDF